MTLKIGSKYYDVFVLSKALLEKTPLKTKIVLKIGMDNSMNGWSGCGIRYLIKLDNKNSFLWCFHSIWTYSLIAMIYYINKRFCFYFFSLSPHTHTLNLFRSHSRNYPNIFFKTIPKVSKHTLILWISWTISRTFPIGNLDHTQIFFSINWISKK